MTVSVEHDLRFTSTNFDENLLGFTKTFDVLDYITSAERPPRKFSAQCTAIFVKNVSGGTVAKGACIEAVDDDTYYFPFGTGAVAGDEELCMGVVSPFIAASTVADDAAYWCIVHGLTKVRYDGSADIDPGDPLSTAASGDVKVHVLGTDPEHCRIGVACQDIASGSSGDLLWAYLNNLL